MRTFVILLIVIVAGGFVFYKYAYPKLFAPKTQNQTSKEQAKDRNGGLNANEKVSDVVARCEELASKGELKEAISLLNSEISRRKEQKSEELCSFLTLLTKYYLKSEQFDEAEKTIIRLNSEYPNRTPLIAETLELATKQRNKEKRLKLLESLIRCKDVAQSALSSAERQLEIDNKILAWEFFTVAIRSEQLNKTKTKEVKSKCTKFAQELLFNASPNELGEIYIVNKGDSLHTIAKKFKTNVELIQKVNGMGRSSIIQAGTKLKILTGKFKIVVDKSDFLLYIYYDGKYVNEYLVGTGRPEDETPVIPNTRIKTKIIDPVWTITNPPTPNEDPKNPLGSRWMGFEEPYASYGIHGIKPHLESTIGKAESDGCIRLVNKDVEEIFDIAVSLEQTNNEYGTEITVQE